MWETWTEKPQCLTAEATPGTCDLRVRSQVRERQKVPGLDHRFNGERGGAAAQSRHCLPSIAN